MHVVVHICTHAMSTRDLPSSEGRHLLLNATRESPLKHALDKLMLVLLRDLQWHKAGQISA